MRKEVYRDLQKVLNVPASAWPHLDLVARCFGVSVETVTSIYCQETQTRVKTRHHQLKQRIAEYAARYISGSDILDIVCDIDFAPCVFLRRLLEQLPLGLGKQAISEIIKQPESLTQLVTATEWLTQRQLERLQLDVERCVQFDRVYSPASDKARHCTGVEHEALLCEMLSSRGISYWTEDTLRLRGFFKTPDVKLQVPIAVRDFIVNWVDSKATFGDENMHRQQMDDQYRKYVNRYGPGMVIYWFGYVEGLEGLDDDVLVADKFPLDSDIIMLPQLQLETVSQRQQQHLQGLCHKNKELLS